MAGSTSEQHIMISYCWKAPAQEIMKEVKKQLERKGYKVWMDVEQMRGNMYEAMAQAIQNSFVVLACVTQGYQDSANCQRELAMACDAKKPIVPIKLGSFTEVGWLRAAIAGLLYYKIQSVVEVEQRLPDIIKEIERIRGSDERAPASDLVESDSKPAAAANRASSRNDEDQCRPARIEQRNCVINFNPAQATRGSVTLTGMQADVTIGTGGSGAPTSDGNRIVQDGATINYSPDAPVTNDVNFTGMKASLNLK